MRRRLGGALGIALLASTVALGAGHGAGADINTPVKLKRIISGLSSPVALAWRTGDTAAIYVAQQTGSVVRVKAGKVTGTVLGVTVAHGGEQGLLGIVFSKDGTKLYVDYTDPTGDIHVVEYVMSGNVAGAARPLLTIPH